MATFKDMAVKFIDVSRWQDNYDTAYKPTFEKARDAGFQGVVIRVGYGLVKDGMFDWFWEKAKGVLERVPYWYLDYYSNKGTGMSDYDWGVEQANVCYEITKYDVGESPLFVDCENYSGAWRVNWTNRAQYGRVLDAFLAEWKRLTGTEAEIYASPGFVPELTAKAKSRSLWAAWYNRSATIDQVIKYARDKGWTGKIIAWQYTSDGDINDDGYPDGRFLGFETDNLDLNVWLGTLEEWSKFCGGSPQVVVPPVEDEVIVPVPTEREVTLKIKRVVASSGLNIRYSPTVSGKWLDWAPQSTDMVIQETRVKPGEIWHRIGFNQWCAELYNGQTLMR